MSVIDRKLAVCVTDYFCDAAGEAVCDATGDAAGTVVGATLGAVEGCDTGVGVASGAVVCKTE